MNAPEGYIEELMERYHDQLYKQCKRMVDYHPVYMDMIDDCIQRAFLKAYTDYDSLARSGNTYGWLVKCCKNYFRSRFRQNMRRREIIGIRVSADQFSEIADPTDSIIRWLEKEDAKEMVSSLKSMLTPLETAVFHDYYENDMSMKDAAAANKLPLASVRAAVQRIRTKLRGMTFFIFLLMVWCISSVSRTI